ncbi:hypothetical protein AGMMS50293_16880 [Spirochaetia bacterium]|nr:hypothetical protein AGMMS50293_16880 [Spirochaetia bacterium]
MLTKHKFLVAVALLAIVFSIAPLAAQVESSTSQATDGLFTSDVDNFLNVNNWQDVEFDKFFMVAQVDGANGVNGGFALHAGSVYLGFGYLGNFWSGNINSTKTEYGSGFAYAPYAGKDITDNNTPADAGLSWTNQVSVLAGTELLGGIRVDVNMAGIGNDNDDADSLNPLTGDKTTAKTAVGLGWIEPGIQWGRNFAIGGGVLKPTLGFSYTADLRKTLSDPGTAGSVETTTWTSEDGFFMESEYDDVYTGANNGQVGLTGAIAGSVDLGYDFSAGDADVSVWAGYGLRLYTYGKQTENSTTWTDYNPAHMVQSASIGVGAWYTLDRKLSLGWQAEGYFDFDKASITSEKVKDGPDPDHEFTDNRLGITPKLSVGVSFKALPDTFTVNASLALYPLHYSYREFEHIDKTAGPDTITDTIHIIDPTYSTTSLGFTWFIAKGLSFDAVAAIGVTGSRADLTNFSALLSYKL